MKKTYTEPSFEIIHFEMNEAIASGCGLKVYNHTDSETCSQTTEWEEISVKTGANLTEDYNCSVPMYGYCYFTSNGTGNFLFNS